MKYYFNEAILTNKYVKIPTKIFFVLIVTFTLTLPFLVTLSLPFADKTQYFVHLSFN